MFRYEITNFSVLRNLPKYYYFETQLKYFGT